MVDQLEALFNSELGQLVGMALAVTSLLALSLLTKIMGGKDE